MRSFTYLRGYFGSVKDTPNSTRAWHTTPIFLFCTGHQLHGQRFARCSSSIPYCSMQPVYAIKICRYLKLKMKTYSLTMCYNGHFPEAQTCGIDMAPIWKFSSKGFWIIPSSISQSHPPIVLGFPNTVWRIVCTAALYFVYNPATAARQKKLTSIRLNVWTPPIVSSVSDGSWFSYNLP